MSPAGARRLFLLALCLLGVAIFGSLGVWQLNRLAWKRDLIARVDARVNAPPAPLPSRENWNALTPRAVEYRRVRFRGTFRHDAETLVEALTERGPGYWVMTPLVTDDGTVLVNRGFVPPERKAQDTRRAGLLAQGAVTVTGLLRVTEPEGRFLRRNDPTRHRWYSRDVAAIAKARGLGATAPFFVDADATPNPGGWPLGGMTIIRFRNSHLIYAVTWFALAAMAGGALTLVWRHPQDFRR